MLETLFVCSLAALTTTWFQLHVVYLHSVRMTRFKNLDSPEVGGFLYNQLTLFRIQHSESAARYAWHIFPVQLYHQHEQELLAEPSSFVSEIEKWVALRWLQDDPDARPATHFHGAASTVASGHRIPNYRALSTGELIIFLS